jgi:photosystem II stability/assembly factor-like uncharacterized protein
MANLLIGCLLRRCSVDWAIDMRRTLLCASLLATSLLDCRRHAQTASSQRKQWRWENPTPTAMPLTSACTTSDGSLVAVGDIGTMLVRRSGQWTKIETGLSGRLNSVACCPNGRVVAVGEDGIALSRSGESLRRHELGAALRAVHCSEDNTVAVTDVSQRVHTQRGDAAFTAVTVAERFVSISRAGRRWLAGGLSGRVYRSDESARAWTPVATAMRPILSFAHSATTVLGVGSQGVALRSTDSGEQWAPVSLGRSEDALCAHHDRVFFRVAGTGATVLRSRDGAQWETEPGTVAGQVFALARDGARLVALGEHGSSSTLEDRGWQLAEQHRLSIFAMHATDSRRFAVGRSGSTFVQTAVGGPWVVGTTNVAEDLRAIAVSAQQMLVVGDGGVILRSTDAGRTWTARESRTTKPLYAAWSDDSFHALVTGEASLLRSTDGGDTWALTPLPDRWVARTIVHDGQWLWIAGDGAKVLRSRDFGANWEDVSFSRSMRVQRFLLRPGQPMLAFTKDGVVVERQGDRWVEQPAPSEILFAATQVGSSIYALGVAGAMFLAEGSPLRWSPLPRMTNEGLFTLSATPSGALYVAGEFGTVLSLR